MTENMVGTICAATAFVVFIGCIVWLTNRREERNAERIMNLYHYCSMRQGEFADVLTYSSGTISSNLDLSHPDQYKRLKDGITAKMDEDTKGGDVIILSLTLIGEVIPNDPA